MVDPSFKLSCQQKQTKTKYTRPQQLARRSTFISCLSLVGHAIPEKDLKIVQIKSKVEPAPALKLSIDTKEERQQQPAR